MSDNTMAIIIAAVAILPFIGCVLFELHVRSEAKRIGLDMDIELEDCPDCEGRGYIDEFAEIDCPDCGGSGLIEVIVRTRR